MFDATRITIYFRLFVGTILSPKISTKCLWSNHFLIKIQKSKRPRTLPNSFVDLFMRVLWNSCNKTFKNIEEKIRSGAPFYKNYTADTFLEVITKKLHCRYLSGSDHKKELHCRYLSGSDHKKKLHCRYLSGSDHKKKKMFKKRCLFFSNIKGLQSRNSDFNKNRFQEKCFLRDFWNSLEACQERSIMKLFD